MMGPKKLFIIPFVIAALFLFSWIVMELWNFVLVPTLNAGPLNFWQAMALLALSKILFGGPRFGPPPFARRKWKSRMRHMSPEDRERMKEEWRRRHFGKERSEE